MRDEPPPSKKYQVRTLGVWLVVATVLIVFFTSRSAQDLVFGLLMVALVVLVPLSPVALFAFGIWLLIRSFVKRKTSSPFQIRGWCLFGTFGILCSIALLLAYWWADKEFMGNGVICGAFSLFCYLPASLGFVQLISNLPLTKLPKSWGMLAAWRRIVLTGHAAASVCLFRLCIYFIVILNATAVTGTNLNKSRISGNSLCQSW